MVQTTREIRLASKSRRKKQKHEQADALADSAVVTVEVSQVEAVAEIVVDSAVVVTEVEIAVLVQVVVSKPNLEADTVQHQALPIVEAEGDFQNLKYQTIRTSFGLSFLVL
jgi:hypothetical protein